MQCSRIAFYSESCLLLFKVRPSGHPTGSAGWLQVEWYPCYLQRAVYKPFRLQLEAHFRLTPEFSTCVSAARAVKFGVCILPRFDQPMFCRYLCSKPWHGRSRLMTHIQSVHSTACAGPVNQVATACPLVQLYHFQQSASTVSPQQQTAAYGHIQRQRYGHAIHTSPF